MAYQYSLTTVIPASARDIYDAWLDSVAHSKMTGGQATASADLGAEFMAWDGYITGRNLELTPGERIVQAWRTTKFPEDHEDSIITLTFEDRDGGTLVTLSHSNVPEGHLGYEQGGWQKSYFEPMIAYFSNASPASAEADEEPQPEPESKAAAEEQSPRRPAPPARRARAKRPAAKKTTVAPKAPSKNAIARNKTKSVAPKVRPKPTSARKAPGANRKAVAQKAQRKRTATKAKPKAKPARAKARAKPKVRAKPKIRAKTRARALRGARRQSAGGRRR